MENANISGILSLCWWSSDALRNTGATVIKYQCFIYEGSKLHVPKTNDKKNKRAKRPRSRLFDLKRKQTMATDATSVDFTLNFMRDATQVRAKVKAKQSESQHRVRSFSPGNPQELTTLDTAPVAIWMQKQVGPFNPNTLNLTFQFIQNLLEHVFLSSLC